MLHYYNVHTHRPSANPTITEIVSVDLRHPVALEAGYCSAGIHPWYADVAQLPVLETITAHPNVVAIGETGLDKLASTPLNQQEELFVAQIKLAEKRRKPLIIHCVKAWPELLHIRKQFTADVPWIIHGFRGNGELGSQLIRAGFYLSFGLHFHFDALHAAWKTHRLYAETDDAEISIESVYQQISSQLSITEEALSLEILENIREWPVLPEGMADKQEFSLSV